MRKTIGILTLLSICICLNAQTQPDRKKIESLCGCYNVEFKYAETVAHDPNYKLADTHEPDYGTELIIPIEISDRKIVLQHLLIISDQMIVKHWREDWTFEDSVQWKYQGNNVWTKEQLKPEQYMGKWFQKVYEVSDAPRYQGSGEWLTADGKNYWENTTDAPLPRREYTTRNDYNVLKRTNKIILTNKGWTHDQSNLKIVRNAGNDKILVEEKGANTYEKKDMKQCESANVYWEKNKEYWAKVRTAWEAYMRTHSTVNLKSEINGKPLHEYLFSMARDYAQGKLKAGDIEAGIKKQLDQFLGNEQGVAQNK